MLVGSGGNAAGIGAGRGAGLPIGKGVRGPTAGRREGHRPPPESRLLEASVTLAWMTRQK